MSKMLSVESTSIPGDWKWKTEAILTTWNSDFIEAAAITLKLEHYQSGTSDVLR